MLRKTQFLLLLFAMLCGCQSPPKSVDNQFAAIDQLIKTAYGNDQFHGSLTIGNQDTTLYTIQLGIANRNWDIPIAADTRFDIASVNKSFIAALIMLAVEEGKLNTESKLVDLLDNFIYTGSFHDSITVHHMLTHSAGLPDYDGVPPEMSDNGFARFKRLHFTNESYVDYISNIESVAKPGERFYYSNFAYHLLCIILEDIYQQSFAELLQKKICIPLKLTNTFSSSENEAVAKKLAIGYNWNEETKQWYQNNFIDLTLGRRIFSTTDDLQKWARAMNDERLLSKASLTQMHWNHLANLSSDFAYGYGWVPIKPGSNTKMGNMNINLPYIIHGGRTEGFKSILVNIDGGKYIISLMSNIGSSTNEMAMASQITKLLTRIIHEKL